MSLLRQCIGPFLLIWSCLVISVRGIIVKLRLFSPQRSIRSGPAASINKLSFCLSIALSFARWFLGSLEQRPRLHDTSSLQKNVESRIMENSMKRWKNEESKYLIENQLTWAFLHDSMYISNRIKTFNSSNMNYNSRIITQHWQRIGNASSHLMKT